MITVELVGGPLCGERREIDETDKREFYEFELVKPRAFAPLVPANWSPPRGATTHRYYPHLYSHGGKILTLKSELCW